MVITAYNPTTKDLEKTYINNSTQAGVTSFDVKNPDRISATDRVLIGEMGFEKTEIVTIDSVSDQTITLTAGTEFTHDSNTAIRVLRYDKVKFSRSTTGIDGTYSDLATVDMDVDNEEKTTRYNDADGIASYYYKVTYRNSVSTQESTPSDPVKGSGYPRGTVGRAIDEFLIEVSDELEVVVTRNTLLAWANDCNDDLTIRVKKPYGFLHSRQVLPRTADTNYISYPTDDDGNETVWAFDRIDHEFNDGVTNETYSMRYLPPEEFRYRYFDNDAQTNDKTQHYTLDSAVSLIRTAPTPATTDADAYYLYYWKFFSTIDSEGDQFETPTPEVYKKYWRFRFYDKKSATDSSLLNKTDRLFAEYESAARALHRFNVRDAGSPRSFGFLPQTHRGLRRY